MGEHLCQPRIWQSLGKQKNPMGVWSAMPTSHRLLKESPSAKSRKCQWFVGQGVLWGPQNNAGYCQCSWLPTRAGWQDPIAEDTTFFGCRTVGNQARTELEGCSLLATCHSSRKCYTGCCVRSHQQQGNLNYATDHPGRTCLQEWSWRRTVMGQSVVLPCTENLTKCLRIGWSEGLEGRYYRCLAKWIYYVHWIVL